MKISTALFGSILVICCTVGLVNGQVKFADGTEQTTAFTGRTTVATGKAFHVFTPSVGILSKGQSQLSDPVPAGQELVILQAKGQSDSFISTRIGGGDPLYLDFLNSFDIQNYPDGTLIVDEGQELWIEVSDNPNVLLTETLRFRYIQILGYYRDK
jgi:hypothetical protein